MSLAAVRHATGDEGLIRRLISDVVRLPPLQGRQWAITSSEVIEMVMTRMIDRLGDSDPLAAVRREQNARGLQIYPWLAEQVAAAPDPLARAVELAIAGNSIDLMWSGGYLDLEASIRSRLAHRLAFDRIEDLKKRLRGTRRLVYVGDNCGEIVFDKLLIEVIKEGHDLDVTFLVRSRPTLNDATMYDAIFAGLERAARIVDSGIEGPLPGVILKRCSPEARELFHQADLIVSKGGGNFDTLGEEAALRDKALFLLVSKCRPYEKRFGVDIGRPILSGGN